MSSLVERMVEATARQVAKRCPVRYIHRDRLDDTTDDEDGTYLTRWYLWPHTRGSDDTPRRWPFRVLLHRIGQSDKDRFLHDHPWSFASLVLVGGYDEELVDPVRGWPHTIIKTRKPGTFGWRNAETLHRVHLRGKPSWTLIVVRRQRREWGYLTDRGWVHWRSYWDGVEADAKPPTPATTT